VGSIGNVIALTIEPSAHERPSGTAAALNPSMMSASENEGVPVGFVDARYELGELLGEGATGQVFAARDVVLGIDVAMKIMRPALAKSRRQVAQFRSEARIASRMLSPHAVKVMGIAVTREGSPCIVYERLEGETLGQRLAREGGLSLAETVEIVKQMSRALARAHMIGVIHRDVKPDNIFLTHDARGRMLAKLLDFGIAVEPDTCGAYASYQLAGTPEYMAPEILFGTHELDARADLYALGAVAYECLTGQCPFPGEVIDVLELLRSGVRPGFLEHRPDLHGAVDAWMDRALHPDPYWRFGTAKELADSFEKATLPATTGTTPATRISVREAA
jgi:serine/threonine-protein kinase